MKRFPLLVFFFCALGLSSETVLVCHGQVLPLAKHDRFKSPTASTILEASLDSFFEKGNLAFDEPLGEIDVEPTTAWLKGLTERFGADRVLAFEVFWKSQGELLVLDHLSYQYLKQSGQILATGILKADITSPDKDEVKKAQDLAAELLKRITP